MVPRFHILVVPCLLSGLLALAAAPAAAQRFDPADQAFLPDTRLTISEAGISNDSEARSSGLTDERTSQSQVSRSATLVIVGDFATYGGGTGTRDFSEETLSFDIAEHAVENVAFLGVGFDLGDRQRLTVVVSKSYRAERFIIDAYEAHTQSDLAYAVGLFYRLGIFRVGLTRGREVLTLRITDPTLFARERYEFDVVSYDAGLFLGEGSDLSLSLVLRHLEAPAVGGQTVSKKSTTGDVQRLRIGLALDRDSGIGASYTRAQSSEGFTSDLARTENSTATTFSMELSRTLTVDFGQSSTLVNVDAQAPVFSGGVVIARVPRTYESLRVENFVRVVWRFGSEPAGVPEPTP
ncbi:MAG: hypothetical protein HY342_00635 [Candidatus Lambdaproteobacteria bacterium]|nr:hypothetical protein [Candidatus Lambdaproteobacteria bacterium]